MTRGSKSGFAHRRRPQRVVQAPHQSEREAQQERDEEFFIILTASPTPGSVKSRLLLPRTRDSHPVTVIRNTMARRHGAAQGPGYCRDMRNHHAATRPGSRKRRGHPCLNSTMTSAGTSLWRNRAWDGFSGMPDRTVTRSCWVRPLGSRRRTRWRSNTRLRPAGCSPSRSDGSSCRNPGLHPRRSSTRTAVGSGRQPAQVGAHVTVDRHQHLLPDDGRLRHLAYPPRSLPDVVVEVDRAERGQHGNGCSEEDAVPASPSTTPGGAPSAILFSVPMTFAAAPAAFGPYSADGRSVQEAPKR